MKRPREPGRVIVGGRCVHTPERQPGNGQARNLLGKRRKNQRRGQRRRAGQQFAAYISRPKPHTGNGIFLKTGDTGPKEALVFFDMTPLQIKRLRLASEGVIKHRERSVFRLACIFQLQRTIHGKVSSDGTHCHTERNHQGLENDSIVPMVTPPDMDAEIETSELLGGMLRS